MLTTQEALEAMAGRSPEGKPLVFVLQQDYDVLLKKHEALFRTENQRKSRLWWQMGSIALACIVAAISFVVIPHQGGAQIEPFGRYFYAAYDAAGVHMANAFCATRSQNRQMKPVNVLGSNGLVFECGASADELAEEQRASAKRDAQPSQFTPAPEQRARCVELRDQIRLIIDNTKSADALARATQVEKLDAEAVALKCWSKP
jgi:hypothetical protein